MNYSNVSTLEATDPAEYLSTVDSNILRITRSCVKTGLFFYHPSHRDRLYKKKKKKGRGGGGGGGGQRV